MDEFIDILNDNSETTSSLETVSNDNLIKEVNGIIVENNKWDGSLSLKNCCTSIVSTDGTNVPTSDNSSGSISIAGDSWSSPIPSTSFIPYSVYSDMNDKNYNGYPGRYMNRYRPQATGLEFNATHALSADKFTYNSVVKCSEKGHNYTSSKHKCTTNVESFLSQALGKGGARMNYELYGLEMRYMMPDYGYGMVKTWKNKTRKQIQEEIAKIAEKYDVCTMSHSNNSFSRSVSSGIGHAAIYLPYSKDGICKWCSDFWQNNVLVYGDPNTNFIRVDLWRFRNGKDGNKIV